MNGETAVSKVNDESRCSSEVSAQVLKHFVDFGEAADVAL
jgi:hypothetical protein